MAVARRLKAFGCNIIGWDPCPLDPQEFTVLGGKLSESFHELLPQVDIFSFHVRLNEQTVSMLDRAALSLVKPGLLLVNTSRGDVIDDEAVLEALRDEKIEAAALDVISREPPYDMLPPANFQHPLLNRDRVFITPHMAAVTEEAQRNIGVELAEALRSELTEPVAATR